MLDWLFRRHKRDREIQDEIEYHLQMLAEDQLERGATVDEAQFAARRKLGNSTRAQEKTREVWILPAIEALFQELRYAARTLRKSPGFALTAVLSIALGIGANTAIFSLIDALLLRTLPVHDPQQLLEMVTVSKQDGRQGDSFPYPAIKALEERADLFSGICGFSAVTNFNAGGKARSQARRASGSQATITKRLGSSLRSGA